MTFKDIDRTIPMEEVPKAEVGDTINFFYHGSPSVGIVRKVLTNSCIVSDMTIKQKKSDKTYHDETIVNHRKYSIKKKASVSNEQ